MQKKNGEERAAGEEITPLQKDPKQQELRINDVTRRGFLLWPRLDLGPYQGTRLIKDRKNNRKHQFYSIGSKNSLENNIGFAVPVRKACLKKALVLQYRSEEAFKKPLDLY